MENDHEQYLRTAVSLILLACLMSLFLIGGCTDRMTYRHEWVDPNGVPHVVEVAYSEGVGTSVKKDVEIILGDGASMTIGNSSNDQDAFIEMMDGRLGQLEVIAAAWMAGI